MHIRAPCDGGAQAALTDGRETGTEEQQMANEDPASAFNPVAQLEELVVSQQGGAAAGADYRMGGGYARKAVADILPG